VEALSTERGRNSVRDRIPDLEGLARTLGCEEGYAIDIVDMRVVSG
jgi:hypothetical protein